MQVYLNFPNSMIINVKNAMAEAMRKKYGVKLPWLKETYDMDTQLPWFVQRYLENAASGEDNHWIVKPCNSACVRGVFVTTHLPTIIRCASWCRYAELLACCLLRVVCCALPVARRAAR